MALLGTLLTFSLAARAFSDFRLSASPAEMLRILRESLPFAVVAIARRVASRIDVILLTIMIGVASSGVYNAAYRVVFLMLMAPNFAGWVVMTIVSSKSSDTSDRQVLAEIYSWSLLIGLPISAGLCIAAPEIISLLFGIEFAESAEPLQILSWLVVLACVAFTLIAFHSARDRQKLVMRYQVMAAVLNIVSNVILIPLFGVRGAAVSAIVAEGALILALIRLAAASDGFPLKPGTLLASAAGVSSFFLLRATWETVELYWFIPLCVVIYLAVLWTFPSVRKHELNMLWHWLRARPDVAHR